MLIWGINFAIAKIGLTELPPILLVAFRFSLVAALLCPFYRLPWRAIPGVIGLAITLGGIHFSLMFSGVARLDAATSAILNQSQVVFAAILAATLYNDRMGWRRLLGLGMALLGLVLVVGTPAIRPDMLGVILVLLASLVWAIANIQIKRIGPINGLALSGWMAFFAAPELFVVSYFTEHTRPTEIVDIGWRSGGTIVYMAVFVSIISYTLWYPLMRKYSVNQIMPFTLLVPVFGVLGGVLLLGDSIHVNTLLGGIATIIGVGIIVVRRPQLAEPKPDRL